LLEQQTLAAAIVADHWQINFCIVAIFQYMIVQVKFS